MRKGLSLIELLVSMVIGLIVLAAIYFSYILLFKSFKRESASTALSMERPIALEVIRQDIEHAGYGLATNLSNKPIESNGTNLTIRSTLDISNQTTIGWAEVRCVNGSTDYLSGDNLKKDEPVVYLLSDRTFAQNGTFGTCSKPGKVLLTFPYDNGTSNGCSGQYCNKIVYKLSSSQNLKVCNPNTRNLLRAVGSSNGSSILDCVADFKVRYYWDNQKYGDPSAISNSTASNIRKNLKLVRIYILVQDGKRDTNYTYTGNTTITPDDNVTLTLPNDCEHYRWKVIKLYVKPMDL